MKSRQLHCALLSVSLLLAASPVGAHEFHFPVSGADSSRPADSDATDDESSTPVTSTKAAFEAYSKDVVTRTDGTYLWVDSDGLPEHDMMVGIRNWQQQVPLPQDYSGRNAWRIPLQPRLSANPISAKTNLFRGAIAVAVNGVPIFNALNNRGDDAFLAGELDQWGGHCGRGDDYHYHIAPVHLEETVGKGNPIAFALDGFPIYGYTEADGSPVGKLDALNGQFDADGNYHYHATKTYPYINGGLRGVVSVQGGQIVPQPRDSPIRPAQRPLRGARITGFQKQGNQYQVDYTLSGRSASIGYSVSDDGSVRFTYRDPTGRTRTETHRPRQPDDRRRRPPPPPRR